MARDDWDALLEEFAALVGARPQPRRGAGNASPALRDRQVAPRNRATGGLPVGPDFPEFRKPSQRETYATPLGSKTRRMDMQAANYGLPPETPGDYLAAGAEALWQGGRRAVGAPEDVGFFAPGSAGDLGARVAPYAHPASAAMMLGYQTGRAVGAGYNAWREPTPTALAQAGIEMGMVPLTALPVGKAAVGSAFRNALASRGGAKAGAGVAAGGIVSALGVDAATAAEKRATTAKLTGPEATDAVLLSLKKQIDDLERAIRNTRNKDRIAGSTEQLKELRTRYTTRLGELTQATLPFDQAFPEAAQYWPFVRAGAPLALGALMKGKGALGGYASDASWRRTLGEGERAVAAMDPAAATAAGQQVQAYMRQHSWGAPSRISEMAAPAVAGGAFGAELAALPAQYDYLMAPEGSDAQQQGYERMTDPSTYVQGAGVGTLSGATGAHLVPGYRAPVSRSRALLAQVGTTPAETAAKMSAGIDAQSVVDAALLKRHLAEIAGGVQLDRARTGQQAERLLSAAQVHDLRRQFDRARTGQQAERLLSAAQLRDLRRQLRASGGKPEQANPPVRQRRASPYTKKQRREAQRIWDDTLDNVKIADRDSYAPDGDVIAQRIAGALTAQGSNVPEKAIADRTAASVQAFDLIRRSGADPWNPFLRDLMKGGDKLGIIGALAAAEAARLASEYGGPR